MKKIIYRSLSLDPFFNIAFEHFLFKNYQEKEEILYLWQNNPSVIIGRFQNPWSECNLPLMEEKKINLLRRESGGGAVFHDRGTAIFSFFSPFSDTHNDERNYNYLISSLEKLGIKATKSSRNDLSVLWQEEERKVSGNAFKKKGKVNLQHGTMLINTHLEELANYLTPNPRKLQAKGIASIRSRVINLKEIKKDLNIEDFFNSLKNTFIEKEEKEDSLYYHEIEESLLEKEPLLKKEYENLKNPNWVLGKTPEFNQLLEETFSFGSFSIYLEVDELIIKKVKIFSDCLNTDFVECLTLTLEDCPYSQKGIQKAFNKLREKEKSNPLLQEWLSVLEKWVISNII